MVIDSSAMIAILYAEPEQRRFVELIHAQSSNVGRQRAGGQRAGRQASFWCRPAMNLISFPVRC